MEKLLNYIKKINSNHIIVFGFLAIIFFFSIKNVKVVVNAINSALASGGSKETISSFEDDYNNKFYNKQEFINMNGITNLFLQKDYMNNVIKMKNGMLASRYGKTDMSKQANNVYELKKFLDSKNIDFLYVLTPQKISKYNNQLPEGINSYENVNADDLIKRLQNKNVAHLDLRESIVQENLDHYSLFFKTDHHWLPQTAFWAFTKIAEDMNYNYGYTVNPTYTNKDNYYEVEYKDWFLGSQGKRVGTAFGGTDDISLIYPKFETDLVVEIPSKGAIRKGSYYDAIFDMSRIVNKDYYNESPYSVYIGGDYPLVKHQNNNLDNNKKILILKDSFVIAMQGYFSLMYEYVDVIDLRHYTEKTVYDYINENKPDIVMVCYNPSTFSNTEMYKFK